MIGAATTRAGAAFEFDAHPGSLNRPQDRVGARGGI